MNLYINNHAFHYEMENLCRAFFPDEKITVIRECFDLIPPYILTSVEDEISVTVCIGEFNKTLTKPKANDETDELLMAQLMYDILCGYFGITLPWGVLTGVRPIKLLRRLIASSSPFEARRYFTDMLRVSEQKTELALITQEAEQRILSLSQRNSFSLYLSIPFCPSRCSYCSFVSQSIEKASHLIGDYTELLCREIEHTAQIANKLGLQLETVYMGGGTPTTLSAELLDKVLKKVISCFDMSTCREFTVEAGRPDTITRDKLMAIKQNQVDRISINPQTLNDSVLELIGRRHTAQQAIDSYLLARECGINNINMDLIAGLNGDSLDSFVDTLDKIVALDPESITVHTLALKRSARLSTDGIGIDTSLSKQTSDMLSYSQKKLLDNDYIPYYLYRQSRMAGNLENVGWSKKGYESLYNVYVMDETHTILACGAGAVTKLKDHSSNHIERIFNFKYPYEYITRFDEIIRRKEAIASFYEQYFNI